MEIEPTLSKTHTVLQTKNSPVINYAVSKFHQDDIGGIIINDQRRKLNLISLASHHDETNIPTLLVDFNQIEKALKELPESLKTALLKPQFELSKSEVARLEAGFPDTSSHWLEILRCYTSKKFSLVRELPNGGLKLAPEYLDVIARLHAPAGVASEAKEALEHIFHSNCHAVHLGADKAMIFNDESVLHARAFAFPLRPESPMLRAMTRDTMTWAR